MASRGISGFSVLEPRTGGYRASCTRPIPDAGFQGGLCVYADLAGPIWGQTPGQTPDQTSDETLGGVLVECGRATALG
jgi:hypothetical protein